MAKKDRTAPLAAMTPTERSTNRKAAGSRQAFEANNPHRMQEVQTLGSESKSDAYMRLGYHNQSGMELAPHDQVGSGRVPTHNRAGEVTGHVTVGGQQELPGMSSLHEARKSGLMDPGGHPLHQSRAIPDLAPAPAKWEDMHPNERKRTLRAAATYGSTPETAQRQMGAQIDQAHARAAGHDMTPYASHFYKGDDPSRPDGTENARQPREVLRASAAANHVPFGSQVVANGITSPRAKFAMQDSRTGQTRYPNDEMASHAIKTINEGKRPEEAKPVPGVDDVQGMHGNMIRAAHAVKQQREGRTTSELRNPGGAKAQAAGKEGDSPFGDKTGPYTNNWLDPHGSHDNRVTNVSDVHTGGGGMAAHIPSEAPYKRDPATGKVALNAKGKPTKDASEREKYLGIPGIHAMHDYAMRNAMRERGLHSIPGTQGTQWGEEQLQRGLVKEHQAYPNSHAMGAQFHGHEEVDGQKKLF